MNVLLPIVIVLVVIVVLVIVLVAYVISLYNKLVKLRNRVDNAWSQIDVQLQRRLDLVPNLVETVKGYAAHESATLQAVTSARTACMNAQGPEETAQAENELSGALKSLFAVAESYPDLKANEGFVNLQNQLAETEDKISYMRQSYNDTVMKFNTAIESFPGVLLAKPMGFSKLEGYDADAAADKAPQVSF